MNEVFEVFIVSLNWTGFRLFLDFDVGVGHWYWLPFTITDSNRTERTLKIDLT